MRPLLRGLALSSAASFLVLAVLTAGAPPPDAGTSYGGREGLVLEVFGRDYFPASKSFGGPARARDGFGPWSSGRIGRADGGTDAGVANERKR